MDTNPNISRLLEMLDNPSAYSEQEIYDCIHSDEETLETYRLMVAARQAFRLKQTRQPADAEAAWQLFWERMKAEGAEGMNAAPTNDMRATSSVPDMQVPSSAPEETTIPNASINKGIEAPSEAVGRAFSFTLHSSLRKIAAIFLAAAFLGGLAWALSPLLRSKEEASPTAEASTLPLEGERGEGLFSFSNVRLDSILTIVAGHYGREVRFRDEAPRELRFTIVWNRRLPIAAFVSSLNEFDGLLLTEERDTLFVESVETEEEE